jgi:hypothetical protein
MPLVRHPDRGEFPGPQQLGQFHRITPIGLDPIETISRRPCLVAKRQAAVFRRKLGHELHIARVGQSDRDVQVVLAPAGVGEIGNQ